MQGTLEAVARGQVHKLVYADGYVSDTGGCLSCGIVQANRELRCARCGEELEPAALILDAIVDRVAQDGGRIEVVKGQAADFMAKGEGGIGAFLRF